MLRKITSVSRQYWAFLLCLSMLLTFFLFNFNHASGAAQSINGYLITGKIFDSQGNPLTMVTIQALPKEGTDALAQVESQEDGSWSLILEKLPQDSLILSFERPHFKEQQIHLDGRNMTQLKESGVLRFPDITLERRVTPALWAAGVIFLLVLVLIALEVLHSTTAALAGLTAIFLVSFVGGAMTPGLFIFTFDRAVSYINWDVIFLVMAMMIIIAIIERTGIFQWMAFQAYRLSRGHSWLLSLILMLITSLASAFLDNFTTMLLMTPITLQIGLALGINPLALIIPEVLASNVGGITTLIGTPSNILIGAYAGISFLDFLTYQTVGVLIALFCMGGYVLYFYRKEWRKHSSGISPRLYKMLQENAKLSDPKSLWKSGLIFVLVIVGFMAGEKYHINVAATALVGATILLIWLRPDIHVMIKSVDWTTLVFFMALFVVVGAVQEVGILSFIASGLSQIIGNNLVLGLFLIVFGSGTLSVVIATIPLTTSLLPIVNYLTKTIPGANNLVLYYALSMGASMGGNGLIIGAEANIVTAGITEQAGTPISFKEFLKIGLPVTYITLTAGFLWLMFRF